MSNTLSLWVIFTSFFSLLSAVCEGLCVCVEILMMDPPEPGPALGPGAAVTFGEFKLLLSTVRKVKKKKKKYDTKE